MNLAIRTGIQTMTAWDIIPRLKRYQMLPQLIAETIVDEAIGDIECTREETITACKQFFQQQQLFTTEQQLAWAKSHCMSKADIIELATRQLKIQKLKETNWNNTLGTYFLQRKSQLDRVIFSMIENNDLGIAQEIYFQLQEKEQTFAELSQKYCQGPQVETAGKLGPVECGALPLPIQQAIHSHQPGDLIPPMPVGNTVVVIRLEKYIQAQLDEITRQRLLNEQFQIWLSSKIQQQGYQINNLLKSGN